MSIFLYQISPQKYSDKVHNSLKISVYKGSNQDSVTLVLAMTLSMSFQRRFRPHFCFSLPRFISRFVAKFSVMPLNFATWTIMPHDDMS
jgi:hypothetical protein